MSKEGVHSLDTAEDLFEERLSLVELDKVFHVTGSDLIRGGVEISSQERAGTDQGRENVTSDPQIASDGGTRQNLHSFDPTEDFLEEGISLVELIELLEVAGRELFLFITSQEPTGTIGEGRFSQILARKALVAMSLTVSRHL
jgi:hypothetical protein